MTNWWQLVANLHGSGLGLQRGTVELPTSPHQILIVQKPYDFMESQNQATELAKSLNRFWDIESAGITETSSKVNEDEQFLRFIKFDKDEGRYKKG